jgi:hypothetical protein
MKTTDQDQIRQYLGVLRRLAPHTVWFGSSSAEEWEWMLESRGGGLPSSTEITSVEIAARGGGHARVAPPFIGATTERRHKGVRMTVDVGSAHLRILAQSPGLISFGAWLEEFYAGLAARYDARAPVWESDEPRLGTAEIVRSVEEARERFLGDER